MVEKTTADLKLDNAAVFASAKPGLITSDEEETFNADHLDSYVNKQDTAEQGINSDLNLNGNNIVNSGNQVKYELLADQYDISAQGYFVVADTEYLTITGPGFTLPEATEDGTGLLTINQAGNYYMIYELDATRTTSGGGNSQQFFNVQINKAGEFNNYSQRISFKHNDWYPCFFEIRGFFNAGDTLELYRVLDGDSSVWSGEVWGLDNSGNSRPDGLGARLRLYREYVD